MKTSNIIYGFVLAAAIVIAGAFMKIQQIEWAEIVLLIGMIMQVVMVVAIVMKNRKNQQ